jgi:hypothetical protein
MANSWRIEADDEWLAAHSSDTFQRLRRRARLLGGLADAMSNAELGPFGGAPRRPALRIGRKDYSVVRYADHHLSYTVIQVDPVVCRRCGALMAERHLVSRLSDGIRTTVGAVRMCRNCQAEAWLFHSHMPTTRRARARGRKVVL